MSKSALPKSRNAFLYRHIGPRPEQIPQMLKAVGCASLEELVEKAIPNDIRLSAAPKLPLESDLFDSTDAELGQTEADALRDLRAVATQNVVAKSYIGRGYTATITPPVILRNILENPGWYTQYTPYQAEIAQGRLEALLNFQQMITDLTALPIANASLLDEGTAAAEGMLLAYRVHEGEANKYFISERCHPQTIEVVRTRAWPLKIEVTVGDERKTKLTSDYFGALLQYPASDGELDDPRQTITALKQQKIIVTLACDILSLALITPPGELGADIAVGNSQRFGVPMGFGGPHAAFMATRDEYKRQIPGRLIGVSRDAQGNAALRLSLQTREQHIRREKATSNICTAQVLLAVMASMYAVYHGPEGVKEIAETVHRKTNLLRDRLKALGFTTRYQGTFDTLRVDVPGAQRGALRSECSQRAINFAEQSDGSVGITLDESTTLADIRDVLLCFVTAKGGTTEQNKKALSLTESDLDQQDLSIPQALRRTSSYLTHRVFNTHRSETEMLRYIHRLQAKDLSLTTSMIPLGSCTMKLNATAEMIPVTWPEFANMHPFAPEEQTRGYKIMLTRLEQCLAAVTGLPGVSLQPNSGAQGEYAGLLVIRKYLESKNEGQRTICLIPESAHGTNPSSAIMAGFEVVAVKCDERGNVDVSDLKEKAATHSAKLGALMITYPSTHGVFEEAIREITDAIHENGGQVYMDGANMNAQVGLCKPGDFGVDVCHLNLHKTFCIPHGGGGPGVGPIAVQAHLRDYLPGHPLRAVGGEKAVGPISAAPYGSAAILPIPYTYIRMMGSEGLKYATTIAILNANYIASRLEKHYPVLYRGGKGLVAHECILELRPLKASSGVEAEDIAKRLMDYGFHAPTMSFPVPGTFMVEPTESESLEELDRFCDAMISIREEIAAIESGKMDRVQNPLKNAPHTAAAVLSSNWDRPYSREQAAFPRGNMSAHKYWPPVARVDNVYGDRNIVCTCVGMDAFTGK